MEVGVYAQMWGLSINVGTFLPCQLKGINYAVLNGLGTKTGVANMFAAAVEIDRQGVTRRQVLRPGNTGNHIAHLLSGIDHRFAYQGQNDPVS